jgi:hypothetical protein
MTGSAVALGYKEIMGQRQRYRVLDLDRLCKEIQRCSPLHLVQRKRVTTF